MAVTSMVQILGNFSFLSRVLFWVIIIGSLYPYPGWGSPYESADHYWPMYNITDGFLEDLEGAAHTVVYNGGKIVKVPQLGHALSLDGKDDFVDTGGFNADCVTEPSTCKDGFTLTFWLKVYGSGYIMSSGSFTNHRNGPGYQLYYHQSLKRFKFLLETRNHRWSLLLHEEVGLWTHMAFTWNIRNGLRYYEDGNLSTFTNKPVSVSPLRQQNYTPIITLARPSNILRLKEYGKFEISQFAIWLKELSALDIAGVHRSSVVYDQSNVLCCHHKSVSPCHSNPCYDPDLCRQISQSHVNCICPNVNLRLKTCKEKISGECEDKSTGCKEFAAQSRYCQHRKMRKICPRSCSYCAPELPSTTVQPTLSTGSTLMSRLVRESKGVSTQPQSSIPYTEAKPTLVTYDTTSRNLTTGHSCEALQCKYYARCVQTEEGHAECRCQQGCSTERRPICGTNGKTYLNMCVLKMEACYLGQWIARKHHELCGEPFTSAVHYFPMNETRANKKLIDLRGNASARVHNEVKTSIAEQLGEVLILDGKDNNIEINDVTDDCIVNPTECTEGLSVAFWMKYVDGEFIISSGGYTYQDYGPGFRFVCQNCSKIKRPHAHSTRSFILELSTTQATWKIVLDCIPHWWYHFAFTWNGNHGLKFYENGKLAVSDHSPKSVVKGFVSPKETLITIGRPNSLKAMLKPNSFGNFRMGHLVVWLYELSPFDVEVAFLTIQTKTTKSIICCNQMKEDPCIKNPCQNGATCHRMEHKYKCICTDVIDYTRCFFRSGRIHHSCGGQRLSKPCEDQSPQCSELSSQKGFCNKKLTQKLCPKACKFCGTHTTQGPGLLSASSQGLFLLSSHGVFSSSAQLPLKMSSTFMTFSPTSLSALTGGSTVIVQSLSTLLSSTAPKVSPSFQTSFHVRISPSFTSFILSRTLLSTVSTDALKSSGKFVSLVSRSSARVKHTSSFASVTSVQSLLTYTVPTQGKSTLACKIKNKTCLCYNCEEALINMKICCMDLIDMKNIRHGVTMNMTNITVSGFYQKLKAVSSIIAEEIWKSCQENSSLCVSSERTEDISGKRRRRSLQEVTLRNNPIFERIRTKREALRLSKNSAEINISHVDVIIYSISSKLGDPTNVETTFFVTMTSLNDGANQTMAVDGKGLLQILRNKRRTLEDRLNISIDSFAASKKSTGSPTTVVNNSESMPHPSAGSANVQTPPSSREVFPTTAVADKSVDAENQGLPQGTMILIVCAGGAGLILLLIVLVFVITRFVKQRKGEFLPDKIYNDCHDKENGDASMEDVQSLPSIIDPSTPRITDVPHKPTRAQSTGGGGGSRGAKKPKKPMGVQVTYKPPEWD
ncbi:uncharacterized protein [Montipora foliosa]|uniref:uncharacterized protein n=1 Tax=Montipora foliosa TaxID=591990 RepID=UPI0035F197EA